MDIKIGAGGDFNLNMNANGDLVAAFDEKDTLTEENVNVIIHPAILGQKLVQLLGGATWLQGLVNVVVAELAALIPADAAPASIVASAPKA